MRDIDALAATANALHTTLRHGFHGGGWDKGDGDLAHALLDRLSELGFAIVDQEAALRAGGSLNELRTAVRAAWSAETSADGNWTPANPALGQCAVTALIVQDLMGGRLLRTTVNGTSHYLNELPDGRRVDLTFDQFYDAEPVEREREYVLSFPATASRYDLLRSRL